MEKGEDSLTERAVSWNGYTSTCTVKRRKYHRTALHWPKIRISKHLRGAKFPSRQTAGSVGYDLTAVNELQLDPGESGIVRFGLLLKFPDNRYFAEIHSRSGLARKYRIEVAGGPGIIDSDFEGLIAGCMVNHGVESYTIRSGERVAQLLLRRKADVELISDCEENGKFQQNKGYEKRGGGGFGSTGMF